MWTSLLKYHGIKKDFFVALASPQMPVKFIILLYVKPNAITQTNKYLITISDFFFLDFLERPPHSLTVDCAWYKSRTVSKNSNKQLQVDLHRIILLILIEFLFISIEIYWSEPETLLWKRERERDGEKQDEDCLEIYLNFHTGWAIWYRILEDAYERIWENCFSYWGMR